MGIIQYIGEAMRERLNNAARAALPPERDPWRDGPSHLENLTSSFLQFLGAKLPGQTAGLASPELREHLDEAHSRINGLFDQLKGAHGLPGIQASIAALALQPDAPAHAVLSAASYQFEAAAVLSRKFLGEAVRLIDILPKTEREIYLQPLEAAVKAHADSMSHFYSDAESFIDNRLALEEPSILMQNRLKLGLQRVIERAQDVHPVVERRLAAWQGDLPLSDPSGLDLSSSAHTDLTASTLITCSTEKNLVTVSIRRPDPVPSEKTPEITIAISGTSGGRALAQRAVSDLRAILGAGGDLFGSNGEVKDLSMLQELTQLGRVTARNLVVSKNMAGQVLNSIDYRACRFEGCNLRAADFSGATFDRATKFIRCQGIEHARFDSYLELNGISTVPRGLEPQRATVTGWIRNALSGFFRRGQVLSAQKALEEIRDSEHFQGKFQITDMQGMPVAAGGRTSDSMTVHFSGGCVVLNKVDGSPGTLKAEVFQLVGEQYEKIPVKRGRPGDSPIYEASAEYVMQWVADVCNQYPLPGASLAAKANRFRKDEENPFAVAA